LPFEGLIYARFAVTLAPTFFFGDAAFGLLPGFALTGSL